MKSKLQQNRRRPLCRLGATLSLVLGIFFLSAGLCPRVAHAEASQGGAPKPYVFGVFPHLAANQIETTFAPMAADLARALGRPVELRTRPTFEAFVSELARETFDIAFVQPFDYVPAHDAHGYLPLARRGELVARLLVRDDSPIVRINDLKGMTVGLPPVDAAVSHLIVMMSDERQFSLTDNTRITHYKAHDSCLNALLVGSVAACGTAPYPQRFFENKWHVKFRTIAESDSIPNALFVANKRVDGKDREIVLKTILSWADAADGHKLPIDRALTEFVPTTDAEYAKVRTYLRQRRQ